MYIVPYYIVFAMRNESTMVNSKKKQILYYCFTLQSCIIQLSISFDRHVLRLTCIDFNIYIKHYMNICSKKEQTSNFNELVHILHHKYEVEKLVAYKNFSCHKLDKHWGMLKNFFEHTQI